MAWFRCGSSTINEVLPEILTTKIKAIISGGTESTNSMSLTVRDLQYFNGYYIGVANDLAGDLYKLYSPANTGAFTVVKAGTSRDYPARAIAYDRTNIWVALSNDGYSNRRILRQSFADFVSTSTALYTFADSGRYFHDAVSYGDRIWIVGQTTDGNAASFINTADGGTSGAYYTHTSFNKPLVRGCMYNSYPIAISADGYYTYKSSISADVINGQFKIASDFASQCLAQMGDYLCVAGTKSDGTYIYYAKGVPRSLSWKHVKLSSSTWTAVELLYVNDLYILAYLDTEGKTKYWCSSSLETNRGIVEIPCVSTTFTAKAACTNGSNIMNVIGEDGSTVGRFMLEIG